MCTVSFLPLDNDNFILTSNRDETPYRKTISPDFYLENNASLLYPKDELVGGTWIGASNKKRVICLLNGAFTHHQRNEFYKMSRGVFVKKILAADNAILEIQQFDFLDIEPFTLILIEFSTELTLHELVWDGFKKHLKKLPNLPKIWSSSTLYNDEMKLDRKTWFANWLQNNDSYSQEAILNFHQNTTNGTKETAVKMKRTFVETVSITSIEKKKTALLMSYFDLLVDTVTKRQMTLKA